MLFGESEYRQRRRGDSDAARRRIVILLLFLVLALGVAVLAPRVLEVLSSGAGESGSPSDVVDFTPQDVPDADLEPGEVQIHLGGGETIDEPAPIDGPSAPQEFEPRPEILAQVRDRTEELDPKGLAYLFQRILTDENWSPTGAAPPLAETTALWQRLIDRPTEYRGQEVLLRGKLVSLRPDRGPLELAGLPEGNPSGLNRYFVAFLHTGQKFFLVAVGDPPAARFSDREIVSVRGLFLQLYSYNIVHEGQVRRVSVPAIVGRSFVRQEPVTAGGPGALDILIPAAIVLTLAFLAILGLCAWIFRRGNERYEERLRETRERLGVTRPIAVRKRPSLGRGRLPTARKSTARPGGGAGD